MSDSEHLVQRAQPGSLADVLDCTENKSPLWRPAELEALLRHQMAAPVQVDLSSLAPALAEQLRGLSDAQALTLRSFADLFQHPQPPVELLRLVKDFAKAAHESSEGPLPPEIARVLYYASIAAALARLKTRITSLSDVQLREGFGWVQTRDWIDPATKELVNQALPCLS